MNEPVDLQLPWWLRPFKTRILDIYKWGSQHGLFAMLNAMLYEYEVEGLDPDVIVISPLMLKALEQVLDGNPLANITGFTKDELPDEYTMGVLWGMRLAVREGTKGIQIEPTPARWLDNLEQWSHKNVK